MKPVLCSTLMLPLLSVGAIVMANETQKDVGCAKLAGLAERCRETMVAAAYGHSMQVLCRLELDCFC